MKFINLLAANTSKFTALFEYDFIIFAAIKYNGLNQHKQVKQVYRTFTGRILYREIVKRHSRTQILNEVKQSSSYRRRMQDSPFISIKDIWSM